MKSGLIVNINKIAERIEELTSIGGFLTPEVQVLLEELKNLKIDEIIVDLQKGNYLGNRKIDIDLGLNNNITTSSVSYSHVKIVLNTGKVLNIPFAVTNEDKSTSIFELTSHADIKAYITAHTLFITNVKNTEVTIEEAIGKNPLLIRFRDSDGFASNIDKIILSSYSGNFKEAKPSYFWAKTTSSLETIANRVGDIIALGNDIGSIITLATKRIEIQALNDNLPILINVNADLPILKEVNADLSILKEVNANKLNIDAVKNNETNINAVKAKLTEISNIFSNLTEILNAKGYSQLASEKAKEATDIRDEIINFNPKVVHVAASEPVSISYNSTTGEYTILMPKGLKGDRGEAFKIEASGTLASKSAFDGASKGFAFLSLDESPTKVYFKATDTSGDWTVGIAFGKGDKGERGYGISNISLTNTSNLVDTYTITFEDSTTFTFNVTNGSGDMQTANNLSDVVASIARDNLSIYSKGEIDGFIATINNLITSDDLTLDEFQEIVNFIKQNKSDLQTLDLSNISETLTLKHFTVADKTKLTDAYKKQEVNNLSRGLKNLFINGNFNVWQRGTSFTAVGSNKYTADRWSIGKASTSVINVSKVSNSTFFGGVTKSKSRLRIHGTSNNSNANQVFRLGYKMEVKDFAPLLGQTLTLSFQTVVAGGFTNLSFTVWDSKTQVNHVAQTINVSNSSGRTVITFTLPTLATTIFSDVNDYLYIYFQNNTPSSTFDWQVSDMQLEVGEVATPFENRPYSLEFSMCKRYFEVKNISLRTHISIAGGYYRVPLCLTEKRVIPSVNLKVVGFATNVSKHALTEDYVQIISNSSGEMRFEGYLFEINSEFY